MKRDTMFLEQHGAQWRVAVKVPLRLRLVIGKTKLKYHLGTDSLAVANREKLKHVQAFREQLEQAEARLRREAGRTADPLIDEALSWRDALVADETGDHAGEGDAEVALRDREDEVERRHGEQAARQFRAIADGTVTPLAALVEDWLAERSMKPRQVLDYRRAVLKLASWLTAHKLSSTVEGVTRKTAGRYISGAFVKGGVHWKTANKDVSCLSSYWRWLEIKGHVSENVWKGQSLQKQRAPTGTGKRPYTDEEVTRLLAGETHEYLKDAITIAACSGMRIEEIAQLRVRSIANGCMDIRNAKTAAGERVVPIHSALAPIIARRCAGKAPAAFLFHELPAEGETATLERSSRIVKAFTRYRRTIGVDDVVEGSRQSRVDLHSLRRWFMKSAKEALERGAVGFTPWTIADVVGHEAKEMALGLTMAHYPGPSSHAAKRACVEAVRLPRPALDLISPSAS